MGDDPQTALLGEWGRETGKGEKPMQDARASELPPWATEAHSHWRLLGNVQNTPRGHLT